MTGHLHSLIATSFARRALARCSAVCLWVSLVFTGVMAVDRAGASETLTPLLLSVLDAPIPFAGSDGRTHLVYELTMTNFSSADITVEKVGVLGGGVVFQTLESKTVAGRLQPIGLRVTNGVLAKSTQAMLFVHVVLAAGTVIPDKLSHRVSIRASAAPSGQQELTEDGGTLVVGRPSAVSISPPLAGDRYISADACCDATRHTRAVLPVNGRAWVAQRYAVDWEELNAGGRIYAGPKDQLESYAIFGRQVLAVANASVVSVTDGRPEQTPGRYPTDIPLDAADGNSIILDLGNHIFALYAHLQPGRIKVRVGDRVTAGQVLGVVGDSGNSIVPHLHFQVMDAPSSLAADGLPYQIKAFQITGRTAGTEAFDEAEDQGTPLAITTVSPPQHVESAMPLDQLIVSFAPR